MKRLTIAVAAVAVAASLAPAASAAAADCPTGFYRRGTGVVNPATGREFTYCSPIWPA